MKVKVEKVNPILEPMMYKLVNERGEVLAFPTFAFRDVDEICELCRFFGAELVEDEPH
jgi:hypothetical protein